MLKDDKFYKGEHRTEDEIDVLRGTLQGASLSPLLFNTALSKALRVLEERKEDGNFVFEDLFATMFADDVLIQGEPSKVIRALEAMAEPLASAGLNIKYVKVLPHSTAAAGAYSADFSESKLTKQKQIDAKFEMRPPLDAADLAAQVQAGFSYVSVPIGTDRFIAREVKKLVSEAECTIHALVDFVHKGRKDTSRTARRFNHASYSMHLFSLSGTTHFDYLYHHIPSRMMNGLANHIQTLLDDSFASITASQSLCLHIDGPIFAPKHFCGSPPASAGSACRMSKSSVRSRTCRPWRLFAGRSSTPCRMPGSCGSMSLPEQIFCQRFPLFKKW